MMKARARRSIQIATALVTVAGASVLAQQPAATTPAAPAVGEMAPEFSLPAITRYGSLRDPFKLSDFHGQTVVVAFFPKARTKG